MTLTKSGSVNWAGGGKSGALVDMWAATRFTTPPVFGSAPPDANPPDAGPVVTGDNFGSPGGYTIVVPSVQDYYIRSQYAGYTAWVECPAGDIAGDAIEITSNTYIVPLPTGVAATDTANAVAALASGAPTVVFQAVPGTAYAINTPLSVQPGTRVTGNGQATNEFGTYLMASLKQVGNLPAGTGILNAAGFLSNATGSDNASQIDNLLFDGQNGTNTIGNGVVVFASGAKVVGNYFTGQAGHCIVVSDRNLNGRGSSRHQQSNTISDNHMYNFLGYGIWVTSTRSGGVGGNSGGNTDSYMQRNILQSSSPYPAPVQPTTTVGVTNPNAGYPYEMIHMDDSTGWWVTDNHCSGAPGTGIYMHTMWAVKCYGNSCEPFGCSPIAGSGQTYCGIQCYVNGNADSHLGYVTGNNLVGNEGGSTSSSGGAAPAPDSTITFAYLTFYLTNGSSEATHADNMIYQASLAPANVTGCAVVNASYLVTSAVGNFSSVRVGNSVKDATTSGNLPTSLPLPAVTSVGTNASPPTLTGTWVNGSNRIGTSASSVQPILGMAVTSGGTGFPANAWVSTVNSDGSFHVTVGPVGHAEYVFAATEATPTALVFLDAIVLSEAATGSGATDILAFPGPTSIGVNYACETSGGVLTVNQGADTMPGVAAGTQIGYAEVGNAGNVFQVGAGITSGDVAVVGGVGTVQGIAGNPIVSASALQGGDAITLLVPEYACAFTAGNGVITPTSIAGIRNGMEVVDLTTPGSLATPTYVTHIGVSTVTISPAPLANSTVDNLTFTGVLGSSKTTVTLQGITSNGSAPTLAVQTAAGTGATAVLTYGNQLAGCINLTTGTGAVAGEQVLVTFAAALGSTPKVVIISPGNGAAGANVGQFFVAEGSLTSAHFQLWANANPTSSQAHLFYYWVIL